MMQWMQYIFWTSILIIGYTYLGYPLLLALFVKIKERGQSVLPEAIEEWPTVTLLIAAYNEAICLPAKLENALALNYPVDKLKIWVVTDGSTDDSNTVIQRYPSVKLFYQPQRRGKLHAIQRVMPEVDTEWVVFSDANAMLALDSLQRLMEAAIDKNVGVVAGEKRVYSGTNKAGGETIYWRYESWVKQWEGRFYSVTGTAGELYAVRTSLFTPVAEDSISDDLEIGWAVAEKGYTIAYAPAATSIEADTADAALAYKRRIRVATGSVQSAMRLMLGGNRNWPLAFWWEVISHRWLRAMVTPYCLFFILASNLALISVHIFYSWSMVVQVVLYFGVFVDWYFSHRIFVSRLLIWPSFFVKAHLAMIKGAWDLLAGRGAVIWDPIPRNTNGDGGKNN
jgi:cellulose synthase/poly-beta-1,6-N-acetylglucosamine synthase-like glycosyltransferase